MFHSEKFMLRKLENDRNRTIDYYNFVCKSDGGTSLVDEKIVHLDKSIERELHDYDYKFVNNYRINYIWSDLYDLVDENDIATIELENDPKMMEMIELGQKEILENKKIPWKKVLNKK